MLFCFPVGTTYCQSESQWILCVSWLWYLLFPMEESRLWLGSVLVLISYCRHPGLCLPLSCSPDLLEGAGIPLAADGSWSVSDFLGKLCLAVDSFIFHLDWHLVWRSGTPYLCLSDLFFTTYKACWLTIQEPTEGFSRGGTCYKIQEGRKTILVILQLLSWT